MTPKKTDGHIARSPMKYALYFVVIVLLCSTVLASDYPQPERRVQANLVTSERDPKIRIKLPPAVQYIGADRWPLASIADSKRVNRGGLRHLRSSATSHLGLDF